MKSTLIRGVKLSSGQVVNLLIEEGIITSFEGTGADVVIEGEGLVALTGFVDLHTHLRQPGFEQSETILSGSKAAAKGGYTAVHAMANTMPVSDNAAVVEQVYRLGVEAGFCQVQPIGAITSGLGGETLADMKSMHASLAKVNVFSDDGMCVSDALLMQRALEYVSSFGGVIAQHAQEPTLTKGAQMNDGALARKLGLAGWPASAEASIVARDVLLAEKAGARYHVCHVSTKETVDVLRWAKTRNVEITAEVTPHHLLLTEDLVSEYNPVFKVNPPLRTMEDVLAVRAALADGTIDIVATDHAPHPSESKECEWSQAANGMIGLETAAGVVYETMVKPGLIDLIRYEQIMSLKPAAISGIDGQGIQIAVGAPANITIIDPAASWTVSKETESLSSNNPYVGHSLTSKVAHVFFKGQQTVANGAVVQIGGEK